MTNYYVKMKDYSIIVIIFTCCICRYTSVEIMPENILDFGYGIDFKDKGMLAPSFERFYVVTKCILLTINDLKFLPIDFDEKYDYLK